MKKITLGLLGLLGLLAVGCGSVKLVGDLNVISTRNFDSGANYQLLKTGTDDSKKAFKQTKAVTVDQAVTVAVAVVPGGEFMKNAKLYTDGKKWAVIGDIWGVAESANMEGFKINDVVYIKNSLLNNITGAKYSKGVITGFKDKKECLVKLEGGEIKAVNYKDLSKTDN